MLAAKQKISGFGHRVYKTEDPRATHLRRMSEKLGKDAGQPKWYEMSRAIELYIKKDKKLNANVDFYSVNPVALVERGFPALVAFGFDHRMGKFDLTHFQDSGAGRGCEGRSRSKAKGKTEAVVHAGDRGNARYGNVRGYIEQPAPPRRNVLS